MGINGSQCVMKSRFPFERIPPQANSSPRPLDKLPSQLPELLEELITSKGRGCHGSTVSCFNS